MKHNWQTKKIGKVCEIKPSKKEARVLLNDSDIVSFVPMEDLSILTKFFVSTKERQLKDVSGSYTYFSNNDVLLAKITPCFENGKLGIARNLKNGIGFGSSEYIIFRLKGEIIPEYLYYYLSRETFRQEGQEIMSGAVGHKRIPKDFIENYEIPYPDPDEQQRIVTILDETFSAIAKVKANAEKNLQNARELFESYLQSVFEKLNKRWEGEKLGDICKIVGGGTPSKANPTFYEGNIPWATVRDMKSNVIENTEHKINNLAVQNSSTNVIPKNNIVIATRVGLGKICFFEK